MSEVLDFLRSACLPAKIYLGLLFVNFFTMLFTKENKKDIAIVITAFIIMVLVGLGITWFGNYLCSKGLEIITWLIVLLPFISLMRNVRKIFK